MKRTRYFSATLLACAALAAFASGASATPNANGAVVLERLYNDCPISAVVSTNAYPGSIHITDSWNGLCVGFANGHAWNFSADGGATSANLGNNGNYKFSATVTLNSNPGTIEGGIHLAPWWNNMDGRFQARLPDGEVACFGGRLPFYSFTATNGVHYHKGDLIHLEATYLPNGLSSSSPGTIDYKVVYLGNTYDSGPVAFDMGNPNDPPHGFWGILNDARVGGHVKAFLTQGVDPAHFNATWTNIVFDPLATPVRPTTWGAVKAIYRTQDTQR